MSFLADDTPYMPVNAFDRAKALQWMFWEQYKHEPAIAVARFIKFYAPEREGELPSLIERGRAALGVMEAHLDTRAFFVGAGPSLADISLYAYTHVADEGGFNLKDYPNVGTWRENTYPGAECDIASALYSYSFAPNPAWDFKWAKQAQIHAYQKGVARDYGLYPHIQFGRVVVSAVFQDGIWITKFKDGTEIKSQFLISAIGQLHIPKTPETSGEIRVEETHQRPRASRQNAARLSHRRAAGFIVRQDLSGAGEAEC